MPTIRRRRAFSAAILLALAVLGAAAWLLLRPAGGPDTSAPAAPEQPDGQAAPTTAPYTLKPEPTFVATDEPQRPTGGRVDVVLTYAGVDPATGTVQANGFAAGVLEDGGTCTLTLTQATTVVTAVGAGTADATTTTCGLLEIPSGLSPGTWEAQLSYSSESWSGESGTLPVSVP